jgi:hypothetical protein
MSFDASCLDRKGRNLEKENIPSYQDEKLGRFGDVIRKRRQFHLQQDGRPYCREPA